MEIFFGNYFQMWYRVFETTRVLEWKIAYDSVSMAR